MDPDSLLGKRFEADFRIVGFGPAPSLPGRPGRLDHPDRPVILRMRGAKHVISLHELRELIDSGFVVEKEGE